MAVLKAPVPAVIHPGLQRQVLGVKPRILTRSRSDLFFTSSHGPALLLRELLSPRRGPGPPLPSYTRSVWLGKGRGLSARLRPRGTTGRDRSADLKEQGRVGAFNFRKKKR